MKRNLSTSKRGVNSVQDAAEALRDAIRDGRLSPGQRLIAREIAAQFGGGVGAFREAVVRLAGEGLVMLHPNRGASVRGLGAGDVREIFQLREKIEPLAARLAAQGRCDNAAIAACAATMETAVTSGRVSAFHAARRDFFAILWRSSGASRLCEFSQSLAIQIASREEQAMLTKNAVAAACRELKDVAEHVLAGRAVKAEQAMRVHIRRTGEAVLAIFNAETG